MPNRTNVPTPPANQARSTLQVVSYTSTTDQYTSVVDLNDGTGTSWQIVPGSFKLGTPEKKYVESDNIRAPGTSVVKQQYGNMKVSATFTLRGSNVADIVAKTRALVQAVDNPKQTPYALRIALPQATQYSYAWVLKCKHDVPLGDTRKLIQAALSGITIVWDCAPGYLGDRLTLQNLVINPGFESPMGGGTATGLVLAYQDTLANTNAYTVQAGGALAQDISNYPDAILADNPLHYYRCDEASGTTAVDAKGNLNGTYSAGVTLGTAGGLTGDTDTAITLNGTTGNLTAGATGLPTGNHAVALSVRTWMSANPSATAIVAQVGTNAGGQAFEIFINTTGTVQAAVVGGTATAASAALSLSTWHDLAAAYDGTNVYLVVDGTVVGTNAVGVAVNLTYGATALAFGSSVSGSSFFNGRIDEASAFTTAPSTTRMQAWRTAATTTPAATANSLQIPAAGRVSFGSPAWGALANWTVPFRMLTAGTYTFYLHYTDANNNLAFQVSTAANGVKLVHTIGGVATTLSSTTVTLINGVRYWMVITQFPSVAGNPPYLTAVLRADGGATIGTVLATLSAAAFDALTALVGQPQIAAAGAALGLYGNLSGAPFVALFGPGAWFVTNTGTGTAAGSWELDTTKTYPSGPATSFGAARLDAAPAGTLNALWTHYAGGTPAATNAIGISTLHAPSLLSCAVWVKTSGLGVAATITLNLAEYDSSGTLIATTALPNSLTGNQASWTQLAAAVGTQITTRYVALQLAVVDATAGSARSEEHT